MGRELKWALGILIAGAVTIGIYWMIPQDEIAVAEDSVTRSSELVKEEIILPQYDESTYRRNQEVQAYIKALKESIAKGEGFLPLPPNELDKRTASIQNLLLKTPAFLSDTTLQGKPLHNEMMRILPVIVSSLDEKSQAICATTTCYQAEKYNFVTNTTTRAIVDSEKMKVVSIERYNHMQPDISLRLTHLAEAIALHAPEVAKALGHTPRKKEITMANVRGTMKESPCEDTTHLCVAPTFADHQNERALWAVVDLTALRLAAAKWAGLGKTTTPACVSERSLQNRYIMEHYCQKDTQLVKSGWKMRYRLTGSDGLEIRDVSFKGRLILRSAKIVDWHVSYQQEGADALDNTTQSYIEGRRVEFVRAEGNQYLFGYNDAMGCPLFSTSVVLAFNGPQVKPLPQGGGFMLTQDFRNPKWPMACNYRYENRFEFYNDGSFRIVGVNKGRGCGDHAIYRPVMRIDTYMGEKERFYAHRESGWELWPEEGSEHVDATQRYPYKITSSTNSKEGYYIEPNHGQFGDGSRGDDATLFVTKFHSQEGDKDLLTLGSCCKLDEDGVERYLEPPENIVDENIVLWYVPRIYNDTRKGQEYCWADTRIGDDGNLHVEVWPCTVGPKFVPIEGER